MVEIDLIFGLFTRYGIRKVQYEIKEGSDKLTKGLNETVPLIRFTRRRSGIQMHVNHDANEPV